MGWFSLRQWAFQGNLPPFQFFQSSKLPITTRLTQTQQNGTIIEPIYNGLNDRVAQVSAGVTTTLALDSASALPEVIYTSVTGFAPGQWSWFKITLENTSATTRLGPLKTLRRG